MFVPALQIKCFLSIESMKISWGWNSSSVLHLICGKSSNFHSCVQGKFSSSKDKQCILIRNLSSSNLQKGKLSQQISQACVYKFHKQNEVRQDRCPINYISKCPFYTVYFGLDGDLFFVFGGNKARRGFFQQSLYSLESSSSRKCSMGFMVSVPHKIALTTKYFAEYNVPMKTSMV